MLHQMRGNICRQWPAVVVTPHVLWSVIICTCVVESFMSLPIASEVRKFTMLTVVFGKVFRQCCVHDLWAPPFLLAIVCTCLVVLVNSHSRMKNGIWIPCGRQRYSIHVRRLGVFCH